MLAPELDATGTLTKPMPQYDFGQGHLAAEPARVPRGSGARLRCDVPEHWPLHRASHGPPPRDKLGEDLERQQPPRRGLVLAHVSNEVGDVAELLLVANERVERDLDLVPVEIAVETEQMRLQQLL